MATWREANVRARAAVGRAAGITWSALVRARRGAGLAFWRGAGSGTERLSRLAARIANGSQRLSARLEAMAASSRARARLLPVWSDVATSEINIEPTPPPVAVPPPPVTLSKLPPPPVPRSARRTPAAPVAAADPTDTPSRPAI